VTGIGWLVLFAERASQPIPVPDVTRSTEDPQVTITSFGDITPEGLHADASAKVRAYDGLARRYAAEGNAFVAVHAAWAADVHVVQSVVWQHLLVTSPDPEQAYAEIVETVRQALSAYASAAPGMGDAAGAVQSARAALASVFDATLMPLIAGQFPRLDYLAGLPMPDMDEGRRLIAARLGDDTVLGLAQQQQFAAADGAAVAASFQRVGLDDDAMVQAWLADWSALASYLLETAALVGDTALVTVELRWALVAAEIARIPTLPAGVTEAAAEIRARMAYALGLIEGPRLLARFAPLG
jgi:hypothetical protein